MVSSACRLAADQHNGRAERRAATRAAPPGVYQAVEAVLQLRGQAGPEPDSRRPARPGAMPGRAGFHCRHPRPGDWISSFNVRIASDRQVDSS